MIVVPSRVIFKPKPSTKTSTHKVFSYVYLGTIEANKLQHAMASYHYLEGTEESQKMDQEWLDKNDSEKRKRSKRIIQGTIPEEQ